MLSEPREAARRLHRRASALSKSDPAQARALYERALTLLRDEGCTGPALVRSLHNLAVLYDQAGEPDRAAVLWAEATALTEQLHPNAPDVREGI
jgi:hypothetical protein